MDGGYIIVGFSHSYDGDITESNCGDDYWIVKLTITGDMEWQKALGGSDYDYAYSIQETLDGRHIVAGYTNSYNGDIKENHGGYDYRIVKLTSSGELQN